MHNITIFTPTYNRETELSRLYKCLCKQEQVDFIWLIIDDGSSDNTKTRIDSWIREGIINIEYVYQQNRGKQHAWNNAIKLANSKYFVGVDSDDIITESAFDKISEDLLSIEKKNDVIGLRLLSVKNSTKKVDGRNFKCEGEFCWYEEMYNWKDCSERIDIFKTHLIKEFSYPEIPNVKFIPEQYLYSEIAKKYKFKYVNKVFGHFYDAMETTNLSRAKKSDNALGFHLVKKKMLNEDITLCKVSNLPIFLKATIVFTLCGFYLNYSFKKQIKSLKNLKSKFFYGMIFLPCFLLSLVKKY